MENPFTANDKRNMQSAIYKLRQADEALDILDKMGQDTSQARERHKYYMTVLTAALNEFFPGKD